MTTSCSRQALRQTEALYCASLCPACVRWGSGSAACLVFLDSHKLNDHCGVIKELVSHLHLLVIFQSLSGDILLVPT